MKIALDGPKDFDFHQSLAPGPCRHVIGVGWGDTDPAQIAYTSNIENRNFKRPNRSFATVEARNRLHSVYTDN